MKMLEEITQWADATPNHTYLLEGDRCVGYIRQGTTEAKMFAKPMRFDRRYRKFRKISG